MTRAPWLALALGTLALAASACTPVCDEPGLRLAAEHFAARAPDRSQQGLEALGRACPTLPASLGYSLPVESGPADLRATVLAHRTEDPFWRELFARTCPRTDTERDHALAAEDRDLATRQSCKIDRYGLIAPEDVFVTADFPVFMLYEWMTSGHVDRALARDVVWPLLSASASAEELESTCLVDGVACKPVMESWGLELPRSSSDAPLVPGTKIQISPARLSVEHEPLLPLHAGRPAPDAFVRHVAPVLRDTLAEHAKRSRLAAHDHGVEPNARATIIADHATPMGTLVDTVFTATRAGVLDVQLAVLDSDRPHALPVHVPRIWLPPAVERGDTERPLELVFIVRRDGVEAHAHGMSPAKVFPNRPTCEPPPSGCHDLEAIAAFARQLKELFPHETAATFRTADDVSLQALVSVVDAARGSDCQVIRAMMGEGEIPPECLFHRAFLDAEPRLYFRSDQHEQLVLGEARVQRSDHSVPGGPSDQALLSAYATARPQLPSCFAEQPELLWTLHEEGHFTIIYGRSADDPERSTARVFLDGFLDDEEVERCVLAPLGVEPDRRPQSLDLLGAMQADLVIPTRFEPL